MKFWPQMLMPLGDQLLCWSCFRDRKYFLQKISIIFPTMRFFCFLQKPSIQVEKTFLWNIIIWYAFCSSFITLRILGKFKFFIQKTHRFSQEKGLLHVPRNLLFQSHSTAILFAIIWWWKLFRIRTVEHREFSHIQHFQLPKR